MASSHEPAASPAPRHWRYGVLAVALGLEAVALVAALDGTSGLAAAAHVASAGAIACGVDRRALRLPSGLVFAMTVFLPVVGVLGWLVVASVGPAASDRPDPTHRRTPVPGPEAARIRAERPTPQRSASASARVVAARDRDDPGAIAFLRRALADRDEDVRLLAHAVLESKQRVAYRRVHDTCDLRLAAAHWELARTDLADGDCLAHALTAARHHARAADARHPQRASLALLVGRIELRSGALDDAEAALARSIELGLPPAIAAPYLAEAAFLAGRFDRVPHWLAAAGDHPAIARLRRFWS